MESNKISGPAMVVEGSLVKVVRLKQEFYDDVENPPELIVQLRNSSVGADIFSFLQRFPQSEIIYDYNCEMENFAAVGITTYADWYEREIPKSTRRAIRKAGDLGIEIRPAEFNDLLVKGITAIFNEAPLRQGKPFWHYGASENTVREMMSRDSGRSSFLGAYCGDELVGFVKLIYGEMYARTTQLISKIGHRNKYPNNALISKCVELCVERRIPYLVYGQFEYGKMGSKTLADFKTNNGFKRVEIPRYFVPLTRKGKLALRFRLHRGLHGCLPERVLQFGLQIRNFWYNSRGTTPHIRALAAHVSAKTAQPSSRCLPARQLCKDK